MADFLHYINSSGIKISSVTTSNSFKSQSQVFKTESLIGASGLNAVYDYRFQEPAENADTLNHKYDYYYLDRANHSGAVVSTSDAGTLNLKSGYYYLDRANHSGTFSNLDASTLGTKSGHFFLDRANHSGTVNATQFNGSGAHYYLDRANHSGTVNATQFNGSGAHYFLDRINHSGTVNATQFNGSGAHYFLDRSNHSGAVNASQFNSLGPQYYLDIANISGNINSRNLYVSGLGYSSSSGVDYNNSYRSGTYIVNWAQANLQTITLSGNTTLVFSGAMNGSRLQLLINQDSVGSRTITWPSSVKWPAATSPTLTTTQSGVDITAFYVNNSNYYGTSALDFR